MHMTISRAGEPRAGLPLRSSPQPDSPFPLRATIRRSSFTGEAAALAQPLTRVVSHVSPIPSPTSLPAPPCVPRLRLGRGAGGRYVGRTAEQNSGAGISNHHATERNGEYPGPDLLGRSQLQAGPGAINFASGGAGYAQGLREDGKAEASSEWSTTQALKRDVRAATPKRCRWETDQTAHKAANRVQLPTAGTLFLLFAASVCAQTPPLPTELLATGIGYNRASSPQIAGWASYAHAVTKDVYSFSTYEISAAKGTPFRAVTSTRTGFALLLRTLGPVALLALGDAGVAVAGKMDGTTVGGSYSGGGVAAVSLGKGWWIIGAVRQTKTALSDAQPVVEIGIGWGK